MFSGFKEIRDMWQNRNDPDPMGSSLRALINLEFRKRGLPDPDDDVLVKDIVSQINSWEK